MLEGLLAVATVENVGHDWIKACFLHRDSMVSTRYYGCCQEASFFYDRCRTQVRWRSKCLKQQWSVLSMTFTFANARLCCIARKKQLKWNRLICLVCSLALFTKRWHPFREKYWGELGKRSSKDQQYPHYNKEQNESNTVGTLRAGGYTFTVATGNTEEHKANVGLGELCWVL